MALAIGTQSPAAQNGGVSGQTITSKTFSPPVGSLVVVLASSAISGGTSSAASVTDSLGAHLTWVKLKEVIGTFSGGSGIGSSTIWVADCPSAQTNMTATVTFAGSIASTDAQICVLVMTDAKAAASQSGGTTSNVQFSGLPSLTTSATAAGSIVIGLFVNDDANTAPTVPAGQTTTFNSNSFAYSDSNGAYFWVQAPTALTTGSGSITINDTAPTVSAGWGVAVEILAAGGTAHTQTLTAGLSFVGAQQKAASKSLKGTWVFTGVTTRAINRTLNAALTPSGLLATIRMRMLAFTAGLGFDGSTTKHAAKSLAASASFSGATRKALDRILMAALSFAGGIATSRLRVLVLTAGLSFTGATSRRVTKLLTGALSFSGATRRAITKRLTATLASVGAFVASGSGGRRPPKITLPTFGTITRNASKGIVVSNATTGTITTPTRTSGTIDRNSTTGTITTVDIGG